MANSFIGSTGKTLLSRPDYMRSFLEDKEGRAEQLLKQANGIANLAPDSLFSLALGESTWNPAVTTHSIIGDLWTAGSTNGTDGIVAYWSSHVEGAKTELVVEADHMALHRNMNTIAELRRILLEHLKKD